MEKFRSLIVAAVVQSYSIDVFGGEPKTEPSTKGTAEMKDDGTIVLRLRAELPGGGFGEGQLVYPPTHPDYKKILEHVSPFAPGQTVLVRPWPTPLARSSSLFEDFFRQEWERLPDVLLETRAVFFLAWVAGNFRQIEFFPAFVVAVVTAQMM